MPEIERTEFNHDGELTAEEVTAKALELLRKHGAAAGKAFILSIFHSTEAQAEPSHIETIGNMSDHKILEVTVDHLYGLVSEGYQQLMPAYILCQMALQKSYEAHREQEAAGLKPIHPGTNSRN